VQARLGCDEKGWGRTGWWTREANNSLGSTHFLDLLSRPQILKHCLMQWQVSGYAEMYAVKKKKASGGKKPLCTH